MNVRIQLHDRLARGRAPGDRPPVQRQIIQAGLLALLVWSPLPAASVPEWSLLLVQAAVAVLTAAYILLDDKPRLNPHMAPVLRRMRPLVGGFFAFVVLQVLPLPAGLVRFVSPGTFRFHRLYDPDFARLKFMSLSVAPAQTIREGVEIASYVLLGFLVIKTVNHGRQIRTIIKVLVASGVFQALYGLYELTTTEPRILFYKKFFSPDSVTGTFVNRSHLSGYLEMIVPLAIGLAIARMNLFSFGVKGLREKILLWFSQGVSGILLLAASVVVMSLGIIFSDSRAGIFVLLFGFLLFFGMTVLAFSRTGFRQLWIKNFIRITFVLILVMAVWIGIGSTIQRFALDDLLHENRPVYWANVLGMIKDFPVFGTGLGTFVSAYPAYEKRGGPEMLLVHAHNDYLEYISELGILGAVFLLGAVFYLAGQSFLAWRGRRNPEAKGLALGGIVSLAGMGLHTVTDFNLHIPANMLLFTVILSLTFVMAYYRKT